MRKTPEIVNCRLVPEPYYISRENVCIKTSDHAIAYYGNDLKTYPQEAVEILYLDTQLRPMYMSIVSKGNVDMSPVPIDQIFRIAILTNSSRLIMLHNHPSGVITPSKDDRKIYRQLKDAANIMGYAVLDSIIVGAGNREYYSMEKEEQRLFAPVREYVIPTSAERRKKADMERYLEPYKIENETRMVSESIMPCRIKR